MMANHNIDNKYNIEAQQYLYKYVIQAQENTYYKYGDEDHKSHS